MRNHVSKNIKIHQSTGNHTAQQSIRMVEKGEGAGLLNSQQGHQSHGSQNEIWRIELTGSPTGGTFTITAEGNTTAGIAYNATAAAVESALEATAGIAVGQVVITGDAGGPWIVEFFAGLGLSDRTDLTVNGASLTGGSSPAAEATKLYDGRDGNISPLSGGRDDRLTTEISTAESVADTAVEGTGRQRLIVSGTIAAPTEPVGSEPKTRSIWRGNTFSKKYKF